jgi:hypothetical protein
VLNARNRGFVDAFLSTNPQADAFTEHRETMLRMLTDLARRAQASGRLRRDFVINDLVLVLLAGRGLSTTPVVAREAVARRFAALAVDAFRASEANGSLPRAPRLGFRAADADGRLSPDRR